MRKGLGELVHSQPVAGKCTINDSDADSQAKGAGKDLDLSAAAQLLFMQ